MTTREPPLDCIKATRYTAPPIDQNISEDAAGSGETLHARHRIISKEIVIDAARSAAHVFQTPEDVIRNGTDKTTPLEDNPAIGSTRLTSPIRIGVSTTGSPSRTGRQDIRSPREYIGPQWIRDAQPLDTSINGIYSNYRDPAPIFSKVIDRKFTDKSSADVISCCQMNFGSDTVLIESPNFVNLGLAYVHTSDELGYVVIPTTRIGTPMDGSKWLPTSHCIGEVTADRVSRTGSEQDYNAKTDFETRRENQDFERQNNSMTRPTLDSTPLGTSTTTGTKSHIDLIPVGTKS